MTEYQDITTCLICGKVCRGSLLCDDCEDGQPVETEPD